jgi:hypothetical protein
METFRGKAAINSSWDFADASADSEGERCLRAAIGYDKGAGDRRRSCGQQRAESSSSRANRSKKLILVNTTAGRGSICI